MKLLTIKKSTRKDKKLVAVFDSGKTTKTTHFGAAGHGDFPTWHKLDPAYARQKRAGYIARHGATENWTDPTTAGTLSRYILWEKPSIAASIAAYRRRFRV